MRRELTQSEKEYLLSTERWENEGGNWVRSLSLEKMNDQWGINEFEVIPPFDEHRYQIAASGPTRLNSTYFMKLWNAGTRTGEQGRNPLSINADNQPTLTPFAEK